MDIVQKHNNCTNVPSSQTFRSYSKFLLYKLTYNRLLNLSRLKHIGTDHAENTIIDSFSIVARGLVAVANCLFRRRYLVKGLHSKILFSLHSSCEHMLIIFQRVSLYVGLLD
jgi:hypothetical protein